jgi:hypothetical protein
MYLQGTLFSAALTKRILTEALGLADQHGLLARQTLGDQRAGIVRHVSAAGLVRLPGLLRAIHMLLEAGLVVESEPLIRVLVEVAIVAMWVGTDEKRARRVWENTVLQMHKMHQGIERLSLNLGGEYDAFAAEVHNRAQDAAALPGIADLAIHADLPAWARDEAQAIPPMGPFLYELMFRLFSSSSHADLQPAHIVAGEKTALLVPENYSLAALCALASVADPLEINREPVAQLVSQFVSDAEA